MNASECCNAIGCNCAGTITAEFLQDMNWWQMMGIICLLGLGLSIIVFLITLKNKYDSEQGHEV